MIYDNLYSSSYHMIAPASYLILSMPDLDYFEVLIIFKLL